MIPTTKSERRRTTCRGLPVLSHQKLRCQSWARRSHRGLNTRNLYIPIGSMYGIFTYIWVIFRANVGKYSIHGSYGIVPRHGRHGRSSAFCEKNTGKWDLNGSLNGWQHWCLLKSYWSNPWPKKPGWHAIHIKKKKKKLQIRQVSSERHHSIGIHDWSELHACLANLQALGNPLLR